MATSTIDAPGAYRALHIGFAQRHAVSEGMRREVAEHGWPLPDVEAYPSLLCIVDGVPAPATRADVQLAAALSRALATFIQSHPQAFESYGEVEARKSFDGDLALTLSVPHALSEDALAWHAPRAPTLNGDNPYRLPLEAAQRGSPTKQS